MKWVQFAIVAFVLMGLTACGETERRVEVPVNQPTIERGGDGAQGGLEEITIDWSKMMDDLKEQTSILDEQLKSDPLTREAKSVAYTAAIKLKSFCSTMFDGAPPAAEGLQETEREPLMTQYREWVLKYEGVVGKLMSELKKTNPNLTIARELAKQLGRRGDLAAEAHDNFM